MPVADLIVEQATAIVTPDGTLAAALIAAHHGQIVYIGATAAALTCVTRLPGAIRIDASGCTIRPLAGPLEVGARMDLRITKGDDPEATRMEITGGKIVRWE